MGRGIPNVLYVEQVEGGRESVQKQSNRGANVSMYCVLVFETGLMCDVFVLLWLCWGTQVVLYFLTLLSSLVAGVFDMILHYAKVSQ